MFLRSALYRPKNTHSSANKALATFSLQQHRIPEMTLYHTLFQPFP